MVRNSPSTYGGLTRFLHWATALAVLTALPLGVWISEMELSLDAIKYFGVHKSIGLVVLFLTLIRIVWHRISPPPEILDTGGWKDRAARLVHRLFYGCLILMPLSGWAASSATGIDTVIFNVVTLPRIAPVSAKVETIGFAIHAALGMLLVALIALHVAGALYRTLVVKDRAIARMLRG